MRLARVLGSVVGAAHHPAYDGKKLLCVKPEAGGAAFLAVDTVQAGQGDRVLVLTEGNGTRQILEQGDIVPIRSTIVGVVDAVETR